LRLTRRSWLLAGLAAALPGCGRRKAQGFSGYAFVANQEGGAIAAVDLSVFAVARHIRVDGAPTAVAANPATGRVYALTPENGSVHEIRADTLTFFRKLAVANEAWAMRLAPNGDSLYVLCRQPKRLIRISTARFAIDWTLDLPSEPVDFDLDRSGKLLAISYGPARTIGLIDVEKRQAFPLITAAGDLGAVRFQSDSRQLIAADLSRRMLAIYQVAGRGLIVNLPLAVRPDHVCFSADGGQLFITGADSDAVVVAYPYYTPQIGETVLVGHNPGAMAASTKPDDGYLFVANGNSGDVSILDIRTRKVIAVTPVGSKPGYVTITPDDQYALVLNQISGDMAVIRIANITRTVNQQRRWRKGALFMLIPVGSKPVSAAVMAI
jgi:YVTN family beta-propeller protein